MQAVKSVKVKGERQRGRLAKREIAKRTAQQQWLEGMHLKSVFVWLLCLGVVGNVQTPSSPLSYFSFSMKLSASLSHRAQELPPQNPVGFAMPSEDVSWPEVKEPQCPVPWVGSRDVGPWPRQSSPGSFLPHEAFQISAAFVVSQDQTSPPLPLPWA